MEKLARDLKEHGLLVLGLNFSDWLVRFFLRITKQSRLSEARANTEVLAVGPAAGPSEGMVLFFGGVSRCIHVIECDPSAFVLELERRWGEKHPAVEGGRGEFVALPEHEMPTGAVFMSYAREDEEAARKLKGGLERYGCVVWYDRERLKPGGVLYYNTTGSDDIKYTAAQVFAHVVRYLSFIAASDSPFDMSPAERRAALARFRHEGRPVFPGFSEGEEFYIPVVIDDSPIPLRREPRTFRNVQVTVLPGGEVTPEFGEHMRLLQKKRRATSPVQ